MHLVLKLCLVAFFLTAGCTSSFEGSKDLASKVASTAVSPLTPAANGNVGIGTTTPLYKLDIIGSASVTGSGDVGNGWYTINSDKTGAKQANAWVWWNMTGSYGDKFGLYAYAKNNACAGNLCINPFSVYDDGHAVFSSTVTASAFIMTSDQRLKKDIQGQSNELENIRALSPVRFKWNELAATRGITDKNQQLGFIAQDVETIFPEAVKTDSDGYKAVNYSALISPLVQAFKEMAAASDAKDAKIEELEKRLEKLENQLANSQAK
jgi:hypothetical protein